ncbi:hypothetical protein BLNAU_10488 [Blattamonas nauphoetae]|uniref:Tyr recombinase domain-containing protein n=1 Tax=Blattamonas nauphoetae TaxID=2049346 RepID=A0ABQ9XQC8_9EUKA|nr:hypothetical protein BLNAU_10488 [Blattamonas nauphoetae]
MENRFEEPLDSTHRTQKGEVEKRTETVQRIGVGRQEGEDKTPGPSDWGVELCKNDVPTGRTVSEQADGVEGQRSEEGRMDGGTVDVEEGVGRVVVLGSDGEEEQASPISQSSISSSHRNGRMRSWMGSVRENLTRKFQFLRDLEGKDTEDVDQCEGDGGCGESTEESEVVVGREEDQVRQPENGQHLGDVQHQERKGRKKIGRGDKVGVQKAGKVGTEDRPSRTHQRDREHDGGQAEPNVSARRLRYESRCARRSPEGMGDGDRGGRLRNESQQEVRAILVKGVGEGRRSERRIRKELVFDDDSVPPSADSTGGSSSEEVGDRRGERRAGVSRLEGTIVGDETEKTRVEVQGGGNVRGDDGAVGKHFIAPTASGGSQGLVHRRDSIEEARVRREAGLLFFRSIHHHLKVDGRVTAIIERTYKNVNLWRRAWGWFAEFCGERGSRARDIAGEQAQITTIVMSFLVWMTEREPPHSAFPSTAETIIRMSLQATHPLLGGDHSPNKYFRWVHSKLVEVKKSSPKYDTMWSINMILHWAAQSARCRIGEVIQRRAIVLVLAYTLLRRAELCSMTWGDVNWKMETSNSPESSSAEIRVLVKTDKTAMRSRYVKDEGGSAISPFVALKNHCEFSKRWRESNSFMRNVDQAAVALEVQRALAAAKVPREYRPYSIKHAAVSYLDQVAGVDHKQINGWAGWRKGSQMIETTYSQPIVHGGELEDCAKSWWQSLRSSPGASHGQVGEGEERLRRALADEQFLDILDMIQKKRMLEREGKAVETDPRAGREWVAESRLGLRHRTASARHLDSKEQEESGLRRAGREWVAESRLGLRHRTASARHLDSKEQEESGLRRAGREWVAESRLGLRHRTASARHLDSKEQEESGLRRAGREWVAESRLGLRHRTASARHLDSKEQEESGLRRAGREWVAESRLGLRYRTASAPPVFIQPFATGESLTNNKARLPVDMRAATLPQSLRTSPHHPPLFPHGSVRTHLTHTDWETSLVVCNDWDSLSPVSFDDRPSLLLLRCPSRTAQKWKLSIASALPSSCARPSFFPSRTSSTAGSPLLTQDCVFFEQNQPLTEKLADSFVLASFSLHNLNHQMLFSKRRLQRDGQSNLRFAKATLPLGFRILVFCSINTLFKLVNAGLAAQLVSCLHITAPSFAGVGNIHTQPVRLNNNALSPLILVMECSDSLPSFWSWNAHTLSPHSGHGMLALSPLILVMECSHSLPSFWSWNARTLSPHSGHGMLALSPLTLVMECSHSLPSFWSWNARTLSPHSGHGMLALSPLILVMECSHSLPSFWSWNARTLSPHSGHGMLALSPLILVMECSHSLPSFWSWNARTLSPHSGHGMLALSPLILVMECSHSLPSFWSWNARTLSPHSGHGMLALSPLILVMECSHSLPSFWSWNARTLSPHSGHGMLALSPLILVMECSLSLPSFWSWNARTLSPLILVMECSHSLPSFWSWNARSLSPHSGHCNKPRYL